MLSAGVLAKLSDLGSDIRSLEAFCLCALDVRWEACLGYDNPNPCYKWLLGRRTFFEGRSHMHVVDELLGRQQ